MIDFTKRFPSVPRVLSCLAIAVLAIPGARGQVVTGEVPDGSSKPDAAEQSTGPEEGAARQPSQDPSAAEDSPSREVAPDSIAIPRYEDSPTAPADAGSGEVEQGPAMQSEDAVDAVEIPSELAGEEKEEEEVDAEKMSEGVALEEEVDEKDSTVKQAENSPSSGQAPLTAKALREKSEPEEKGRLGSSIMTRTEARTFTFSIPAPRGQLLDRNGLPLAQSKIAHYAAIRFPFLGSEVSDAEILRYAGERILHVNDILGTDWDLSGKVVVNHYRERRWFPLTFSSVLDDKQVDELTRQKMEGLTLHPVYLRHYPQGKSLSHVLGYVGQRPPRSKGPIVNDEPLWPQGVGSEGLEEAFETDLRGKEGRVNVLFDADGAKIKE